MISVKKVLNNHNFHINNISYKNNSKILETDEGKFILKSKRTNKEQLFNYLKDRNFNNFLPLENNSNEPYELYRFINETTISPQDKAIDLKYILSMLHIKTTTYEEINLDQIKKIYEMTKNEISSLKNYYLDLQDYIETKVYMSPAEYLLIRHISKIHSALNYADNTLENWYKEKKVQKKERRVLLHRNLTLDHFLKEKTAYFINWDYSRKGLVIYDFLNFYKNEYQNLEMESLFELYQSKYRYTKDEKLLFLSLLAIPYKVDFKKTNYINTLEVRKLIIYVEKTNRFISKEYEKDQKAYQEKFEQ